MLDAIDNLLLHFRSNAVVLLHTSCLLAAAKYTRLVYEERGEVHELITTKTDLQRRKSDFGRKGNNWIEPLREWILTAHHAEKLASSNEFDEIKSLVEKIGTNRRLLSKKVGWDWSGEWRIVAENQNKIPPARERSERVPSSENSQCLTWSGRRDSNPESPAPKAGMLAVTLQPASAHAFVRNPSIL